MGENFADSLSVEIRILKWLLFVTLNIFEKIYPLTSLLNKITPQLSIFCTFWNKYHKFRYLQKFRFQLLICQDSWNLQQFHLFHVLIQMNIDWKMFSSAFLQTLNLPVFITFLWQFQGWYHFWLYGRKSRFKVFVNHCISCLISHLYPYAIQHCLVWVQL